MDKLKKIEIIRDTHDNCLFAFWYYDRPNNFQCSQMTWNIYKVLKDEGYDVDAIECGYTPDLIIYNYDGTETHIPFPSKELPCCWASPLVTEKCKEDFWSKKF